MKKKLLVLFLAIACFALAACGSSGSSLDNANPEEVLKGAQDALKAAYGETYYPNMALEAEYFEQLYGFTADDYDYFIAENSMIGFNVDCFIGVHAKDGKGEAVAQIIKDYDTRMREDAMQYPVNIPRFANAVVYTNGDYSFYFILGGIFEEMDPKEGETIEQFEQRMFDYYKEQAEIGKKAIEDYFAK